LVVQVLTDKPHQPARHLTPLRLRALPLVADKRDSVRVIIPSLFLSPTDNFEDVGLGDVVCVDDRSRGMDWAFEEVDAEPRPVVFPFHVCLVNLFDLHDATGYAAAQICRSRALPNTRNAPEREHRSSEQERRSVARGAEHRTASLTGPSTERRA
jgi:hypothetical protein